MSSRYNIISGDTETRSPSLFRTCSMGYQTNYHTVPVVLLSWSFRSCFVLLRVVVWLWCVSPAWWWLLWVVGVGCWLLLPDRSHPTTVCFVFVFMFALGQSLHHSKLSSSKWILRVTIYWMWWWLWLWLVNTSLSLSPSPYHHPCRPDGPSIRSSRSSTIVPSCGCGCGCGCGCEWLCCCCCCCCYPPDTPPSSTNGPGCATDTTCCHQPGSVRNSGCYAPIHTRQSLSFVRYHDRLICCETYTICPILDYMILPTGNTSNIYSKEFYWLLSTSTSATDSSCGVVCGGVVCGTLVTDSHVMFVSLSSHHVPYINDWLTVRTTTTTNDDITTQVRDVVVVGCERGWWLNWYWIFFVIVLVWVIVIVIFEEEEEEQGDMREKKRHSWTASFRKEDKNEDEDKGIIVVVVVLNHLFFVRVFLLLLLFSFSYCIILLFRGGLIHSCPKEEKRTMMMLLLLLKAFIATTYYVLVYVLYCKWGEFNSLII